MIIIFGLLFLSIPSLIFLAIIDVIVSGNRRKQVRSDRQLLKYNNPVAYNRMIEDEEKESERRWLVVGIVTVIIVAIWGFFAFGDKLRIITTESPEFQKQFLASPSPRAVPSSTPLALRTTPLPSE